jgi:hypothetical protein
MPGSEPLCRVLADDLRFRSGRLGDDCGPEENVVAESGGDIRGVTSQNAARWAQQLGVLTGELIDGLLGIG